MIRKMWENSGMPLGARQTGFPLAVPQVYPVGQVPQPPVLPVDPVLPVVPVLLPVDAAELELVPVVEVPVDDDEEDAVVATVEVDPAETPPNVPRPVLLVLLLDATVEVLPVVVPMLVAPVPTPPVTVAVEAWPVLPAVAVLALPVLPAAAVVAEDDAAAAADADDPLEPADPDAPELPAEAVLVELDSVPQAPRTNSAPVRM
jgi:hypothetical protein